MSNELLKTKYLRLLILQDDIKYHQEGIKQPTDLITLFRLIKSCLIPLDILRDSFGHFNELTRKSTELIEQSRSLKKRLNFINHLRNNVGGHLNEILLEKAVEWEPFVFHKSNQSNSEGQLTIAYKTLLESAINSYIDSESN